MVICSPPPRHSVSIPRCAAQCDPETMRSRPVGPAICCRRGCDYTDVRYYLYRREITWLKQLFIVQTAPQRSVREAVAVGERAGFARTWSWISGSSTWLAARWVSIPRPRPSTRPLTSSHSVRSSQKDSPQFAEAGVLRMCWSVGAEREVQPRYEHFYRWLPQ